MVSCDAALRLYLLAGLLQLPSNEHFIEHEVRLHQSFLQDRVWGSTEDTCWLVTTHSPAGASSAGLKGLAGDRDTYRTARERPA